MFLPGLTNLPPTDRDEARYIQATRQMHESGDYVDIRFQDEKRYKKPVGIYWLQAVATAPFGGASAPVWAFRIPSLLGAIAAVFATWIVGRVLFGRRAGLFAALIFSPVVLITVEARLAKTDAVLLACVLLCEIVLACAWRAATADAQHAAPRAALLPWPRAMLFWVGLAAGILVKGPVAPMVAGLTGLVLSARKRTLFGLLRMLRPISGVVVLIAMVAPWVLAIAFVSHGQFFNEAIGHDFLGKVAEGQESHGAPPGTYLLFFLITGWPMGPFCLLAAPAVVRRWREPSVFFCLAWLVPVMARLRGRVTKLPHYTLPLYPALALLCGAIVASDALSRSRVLRIMAAALLVILPLAVTVGEIVVPRFLGDPVVPAAVAMMAAASLVALWGASALIRDRTETAMIGAALSAALLYAGAIGIALPKLQSIWVSPRLAAAARAFDGCDDPQLAVAGYSEPSLVVAAGTSVEFLSADAAAEWLGDPGCRLAAVTDRELERFDPALAARSATAREVASLRGFNYSRSRPVVVRLYAAGVGAAVAVHVWRRAIAGLPFGMLAHFRPAAAARAVSEGVPDG